ncbi:MAG: 50S ribosomal protein L17 [Ignavibacteria bacterium]|nr:50S ribosomal protein L17 [Ignavibacteria bacterium]
MEHRKKGRKLKRTASHRRALLSNLSMSLIIHKRIRTTLAKAKELRLYVEPLLTKAKKAVLLKDKSPEMYVHYAREIRKFLKDREAINILLKEVGPKILERNGGYTRVLKSGFRVGDGGDEAIIELVDFSMVEKPKAETTKVTGSKTAKKSVQKETEETAKEEKKPAKKTTAKKTTAKKTEVKEKKTEKPVKKTVEKKPVKKTKKEE